MTTIEIIQQAKIAESKSEWFKASELWRSINQFEDADSCLFIGNSIWKADRYRELLGDVFLRHEKGEISKDQLTEILTNAWNTIYTNKYEKDKI